MSSLAWVLNIALAVIVAALVMAKWSVVRMAQEINRRVGPGEQVSLKWWPNYKDRRVSKLYRAVLPQGRMHFVYVASLSGAFILFFAAVLLASRLEH